MPIQFTEEQLAFQDIARRFAQREVEPLANRIDAEEHTPDELIAKAAEVGLFGLYVPVEYGGAGADVVSACLVAEEVAVERLGGVEPVQPRDEERDGVPLGERERPGCGGFEQRLEAALGVRAGLRALIAHGREGIGGADPGEQVPADPAARVGPRHHRLR